MRQQADGVKSGAVLLLVIATLWVYWPVQHFDFVNFDDQGYVLGNRQVQGGLSLDGAIWAFTTLEFANWHPLTWLSYMLDYQLFLQNPAGHHWTSVILHLLNTLLLLDVLRRMTGRFWRSFLVAALFALHPLNVESVAWISERKNVLSTFFWFLTLLAYWRYARAPGFGRYVPVFLALLVGLLAKPMLVTLPFVLLLIDFWPLRRLRIGKAERQESLADAETGARPASFRRLVLEKIPLIVLVVLSAAVTVQAARGVDALAGMDRMPLSCRLMSAALSYADYIGKMFWPRDLTVFYPYTRIWPAWQVGGAFLLLLGVSGAALLSARRRPYLPVGWFWYLGTLVPVIGLVQVGEQAMADRYAYVPLIGLFILCVWGVAEASTRWKYRTAVLSVLSGLVLLGLSAGTMSQLPVWRNSITLFGHALRVTRDSTTAQNNFGVALIQAGLPDAAIAHYEKVLKTKDRPDFHINLGVALMNVQRLDEAMGHFQAVLKRPSSSEGKVHNNIGVILSRQGKLPEAEVHLRRALRLNPEDADAQNNLGFALALQGRPLEAIRHYEQAVRLDPRNPMPYCNLGKALRDLGRDGEAAACFRQALELSPEDPGILKLLLDDAAKKRSPER